MSNTTTAAPVSSESEVLAAAGPPAEVDPRRAWMQALVERARSEGVTLTGEDGLLTGMVREVLQAGLDVEMAEHLGYEPYESIGRNSGNSRNGSYPKTVATDVGPVELQMPRDREGERDVLGLWLDPSGWEGAKQWMSMLTELKNRGVADALVVCCDGLKGLPDAIRVTWPEATVQTCVVHLVRNSLRYASRKCWAKITSELREIYTAPTIEAAQARFGEFAENWRSLYPAMVQSWENAWEEFLPFLEFPVELRRIVYTTNAVESLNARFRRAVRHRGHFPNEQAAMKVLYLVATTRQPNRENMTGRTHNWKGVLNALAIHYGDRLTTTN
jgi:transposase-like protein